MKRQFFSRVTQGFAVLSALLPLVAIPTAGAASVPPTPSPATVLTVSPLTTGMNQELQGSLCQSGNTCVQVNAAPFVLPGLLPGGVTALDTAINSTSGSIIVFAYSNGAQVAQQWLAQFANEPSAPSPADLTFVLIGNPTRADGGVDAPSGGPVWPQSQYQVLDIAREYDWAADYPNNPSSPYYLLAVLNVFAGFFTIHADYTNVNINDPANAVWTVGNTTYVLVPTQTIPLLIPLQELGINVDAMNAQLKPLVDSAYNRPVPFPTTAPAGAGSYHSGRGSGRGFGPVCGFGLVCLGRLRPDGGAPECHGVTAPGPGSDSNGRLCSNIDRSTDGQQQR